MKYMVGDISRILTQQPFTAQLTEDFAVFESCFKWGVEASTTFWEVLSIFEHRKQ